MTVNANRALRSLALLPLLLLFCLLLWDSAAMQEAAASALRFSATTLIPALFPFAVLARFLAESGLLPVRSPIAKALAHLLGIDSEGLVPFLLGLFCGYPLGAYAAACLYKTGRLSREDACAIAAIANNPSAPFLLLTVSALFGDRRVGRILFLSLTAATLLWAMLRSAALRIGNKAKKQAPAPPLPPVKPHIAPSSSRDTPAPSGAPLLPLLSDAIGKGGVAMLSLAAFVTFFATLARAAERLIPSPALAALLAALLETTAALRSAVSLCPTLGQGASLMLAAAGMGWSGLSVLLQTETQFEGKLPLLPLVATRAAIATLAALLSGFLWQLLS